MPSGVAGARGSSRACQPVQGQSAALGVLGEASLPWLFESSLPEIFPAPPGGLVDAAVDADGYDIVCIVICRLILHDAVCMILFGLPLSLSQTPGAHALCLFCTLLARDAQL